MSVFDVTLKEYKAAMAEFCKAAESGEYTEEQLENGLKAVNCMYFGLSDKDAEMARLFGYVDYVNRCYFKALYGDPIAELKKSVDELFSELREVLDKR